MFDNNLSPHIASAVKALSEAPFPQIEIIHKRDRFPANTPDELWIKTLTQEKRGACVLTTDRLDKGMEAEMISRGGLIVLHFDKSWSNHNYWEKAHNLVRWWPRIVEFALGTRGPAAFRIPWNFRGKGTFEAVRRR